MSIAPQEDEFFCPNCGDWYYESQFQRLLGWCIGCALEHHPSGKICVSCGSIFSEAGGNTKCYPCKEEAWLTRYADLIEAYMSIGYTFTSARNQVEIDVRPKCLSCGGLIKSAKVGSLFCNSTDNCRKAKRLYKRNRHRRNLNQTQALALLELQLGRSFT